MASQQQQGTQRMNQAERNALVKVVRSRFEVIRKHAKQRRDELRDAIFDRIMQENQAKIEAAQRDMAEIEARARKLEEDAKALIKKHRRRGVKLGHAQVKTVYSDRQMRETERRVETSDYTDGIAVRVSNAWYIADIAQQVERELRKLEREYGLGEVVLATREQQLTERIILGGVSSDEAQGFLEQVPTLGELPSVEDAIKRLHA